MTRHEIRVRAATLDDLEHVLLRSRALMAHEGIELDDELLQAALRRLLGDTSLGGAWLIEAPELIGYAIVTFGYDLEFGGRDAYLTELWIDESQRGRGAGSVTLELLTDALRAHEVRALHLQVRPDNPAARLYERSGFIASPRVVMTRRLV